MGRFRTNYTADGLVAMITLVGTLAVYAGVNSPTVAGGKEEITRPMTAAKPPYGWEVTTVSGEAEIALAQHLKAIGAKEYGAFWCPHCYDQNSYLVRKREKSSKKKGFISNAIPKGLMVIPKLVAMPELKVSPLGLLRVKNIREPKD